MKISDLTKESLQYMHTQPFFNMEQQKRHECLKQIGSQIEEISHHFSTYADLGLKMCNEFKCLRTSFDAMDLMAFDNSIKPLKDIFAVVDETFSTHFNIIYNNIANPLTNFVQKELINLKSIAKEYQKHQQTYSETEEKYASMKPKTKEKEKAEREQALVRDHTLASLSFFEFCKKMEEVELKLKGLLPQMFISYLTSVAKPFSECLSKINDKQELLKSTQATIDDVNNKVQEFSKHSIQVKQQISSQIPIYWEKLTAPYEINTSTKIQGFLRRRNNLKGWHKQYFVVSDGVISYSKYAEGIIKTTKNIPVILCTVKPEPNMPRNNCFSISVNNSSNVPKKIIILQALTHWDMSNWLAVIQNSIFNQTNVGGDEDNENDGIVRICADCGSKHCSWCSINFCVPLCSRCVAEHRFIGANISKVRSLKLDTIDPYQKALIEAIGSENANNILEKNAGSCKIEQFSTNEERRDFIIKKYQKLEFICPNDSIDIINSIRKQNLLAVYEYISTKRTNLSDDFLPIHAAACVGNPLILHLICLNTTKIDVLDNSGWSALSYATYYEQLLMIDILLSYGADPNSSTAAHPYCIAKYLENDELIQIFKKYESKANYHEGMSFSSPHLNITPKKFKFEKFVSNPQIYLDAKLNETKKISEQDQQKIDNAINTLKKGR